MTPDRPAFALLLLCLALQPCAWSDEDDAPLAAPSAVPGRAGELKLSAEQRQTAGLVIDRLSAVSLTPETPTYGKVLDIQPLLDLRAQMHAARAEEAVAGAAMQLADKNRQRVKSLFDANILPSRELAQAEAQWQGDRAREEAAHRQVEAVRREALHVWGPTLAQLALEGRSPLLEQLANHHRFLVQVSLPAGVTLPAEGTPILIGRDLDRNRAIRTELLSAAPRTDELTQGETWYVHAAGEHLRAGMRVNAWIPNGARRSGVSLPSSALVWHAGKAWVYRENADGSFTRLAIDPDTANGATLFVESVLVPGDRVVVTGAQTLLSEEFRSHIPEEDEATENR